MESEVSSNRLSEDIQELKNIENDAKKLEATDELVNGDEKVVNEATEVLDDCIEETDESKCNKLETETETNDESCNDIPVVNEAADDIISEQSCAVATSSQISSITSENSSVRSEVEQTEILQSDQDLFTQSESENAEFIESPQENVTLMNIELSLITVASSLVEQEAKNECDEVVSLDESTEAMEVDDMEKSEKSQTTENNQITQESTDAVSEPTISEGIVSQNPSNKSSEDPDSEITDDYDEDVQSNDQQVNQEIQGATANETESLTLSAMDSNEMYEQTIREEMASQNTNNNSTEDLVQSVCTDNYPVAEEEMDGSEEENAVEIISLDDTDEESEVEKSGDRSEEDEYDDTSGDDVDFSYEPEPLPKKQKQWRTEKEMNRIFIRSMKRRSIRCLNRHLCRARAEKMQIMDENDAVECETKIPNHASPDIHKAQEQQQKLDNLDKKEQVSKEEITVDLDEKENSDSMNQGSNGTNQVQHEVEPLESKEGDALTQKTEELNEKNLNKSSSAISIIEDVQDSAVREEEQEKDIKVEILEKIVPEKVETDSQVKPKDENPIIEDLGSDENADIDIEHLYDDLGSVKPEAVDLSSTVTKQAPTKRPRESEKVEITIEPVKTVQEAPKEVKEIPSSRKRARSPSPVKVQNKGEPVLQPSKKLRQELLDNYGCHDKILREYIETTTQNSSLDELQSQINSIDLDIQQLDQMLRAKEEEWNNMLHLKKVKEEIRVRLLRKKNVLEMSTNNKMGDDSIPYSSTPLPNKSQQPSFNASLLQNTLKDMSTNRKEISNANQVVNRLPLNATNIALNAMAQSIVNSRASMKTADLAKEKTTAAKIQRNILPRPTSLPNHEQILRNLAMSSASSVAFQQQQLNELLNGHSKVSMGRQGPTKDVSSIIADFREKNPDVPPRRGRRVKGNTVDGNSRPSSADSSHSNPAIYTNAAFKELLAQFDKMSPSERQLWSSNNSIISALNMTTQQHNAMNNNNNNSKPPPYPEVTLHPVMNTATSVKTESAATNQPSNTSLLHGILTKSQNRSSQNQTTSGPAGFTNYSPTLARLLTSPERISAHQQNVPNCTQASTALAGLASGLNLTNKNSEITITPVVNSQTLQQTLLAQQQRQKEQFLNMDDDNDDNSTDRLVIDEGDNHANTGSRSEDYQENEIPQCQGCHKQEAQFVCAGCGNQWYCSRECQVAAWDEHSETCTG